MHRVPAFVFFIPFKHREVGDPRGIEDPWDRAIHVWTRTSARRGDAMRRQRHAWSSHASSREHPSVHQQARSNHRCLFASRDDFPPQPRDSFLAIDPSMLWSVTRKSTSARARSARKACNSSRSLRDKSPHIGMRTASNGVRARAQLFNAARSKQSLTVAIAGKPGGEGGLVCRFRNDASHRRRKKCGKGRFGSGNQRPGPILTSRPSIRVDGLALREADLHVDLGELRLTVGTASLHRGKQRTSGSSDRSRRSSESV